MNSLIHFWLNIKYFSKTVICSCLLTLLLCGNISLSFANTDLLSDNNKDSKPATKIEKDSFGRETPRSSLAGLLSAYSSGDMDLAVNYLDDEYLNKKNIDDVATAQNLKKALDAGARLSPTLQISDKPEGDLVDLLPEQVDKVGVIGLNQTEIDVLMIRHQDKQGRFYWQIASETLEMLPEIRNKNNQFIDNFKINGFEKYKIGSHTIADILGLLFVIISSILIVYLAVLFLFYVTKSIYKRVLKRPFNMTTRVVLPFTLIIVALMLSEIMLKAGVPVTLRTSVGRIQDAVAWAATTWLLLRVLDTAFNRAEALSLRKHRPEQVSILGLLRKLAKAILLVFAVIIVFGNLGFDLTTGIAALGVGGLALAFGAQKTVENLIGSIVVVADRPVNIGDYCKFGTYEGTVIDIGIRSTQVRTLNRTIVTIPNGEFSALQIENYAVRDMFHFLHNVYIKRDTPLYDVHHLLKVLKKYLDNHPDVNQEWTQVRISELRQDCFVVEMRAYINTRDVIVFFDKQSQLILELLQQVADLGIEHALPTQHIHITQPENPITQPQTDMPPLSPQ